MTTRKIARALLSVSDKTGLAEFAHGLRQHGVEIVSTGGTAKLLRDAGIEVIDVAEITGLPEMMDGRVKTLHPKIHGGLLAVRENEAHLKALADHAIPTIDLLAANLYPFEQTVAGGAEFDTAIETIDIGGPAMIRAAAKNHDGVTVVVDPADYASVLAEMAANGGATTLELRKQLAARAFARTAAYDAAIASWFAGQLGERTPTTHDDCRPARRGAALWREPASMGGVLPQRRASAFGVATARQVQGKELSYNNLNDTDAAYELVAEFDPKASAAVRHHQARQSLRRGARQDAGRGLPQGAGLRSASARSAASSPPTASSTRRPRARSSRSSPR